MKWAFDPIEVDEWLLTEPLPLGYSEANQSFQLHHFIYDIKDKPNTHKLVLRWEYIISKENQTSEYCRLIAEQSFIVAFDDKDNNLEQLSNLVGTSHAHLEGEFNKRKKEAGLSLTFLPAMDDKAAGRQILQDFQNKG